MASFPSDSANEGLERELLGAIPEGLRQALEQLDARLRRAVAEAQEVFGPEAAGDPYRGLYVNRADVSRLLDREASEPLFATGAVAHGSILGALAETSMWGRLARAFGLLPFDLDVVLLALAPEVDLRYERLFAYLQDDVARKRPSVDLALNLLCGSAASKLAHRPRFAADAPLVRQNVIQLVADPANPAPLLSQAIRLDDQIIRLLLKQPGLDPRLTRFCRIVKSSAEADRERVRPTLVRLCEGVKRRQGSICLYFEGHRGAGQLEAAEALASVLWAPFLSFDVGRVPVTDADFDVVIKVVMREARLRVAILYVELPDDFAAAPHTGAARLLWAALAEQPGITIVAGAAPWSPTPLGPRGVLTIPFFIPDYVDRLILWTNRLDRTGIVIDDDGRSALADRFRLTSAQIDDAVARAVNHARWREAVAELEVEGSVEAGFVDPEAYAEVAAGAVPTLADLFDAARHESGHELAELARKIEPTHTWHQLVLPKDSLDQLEEICQQVEHRHVVLDEWGFGATLALGKGVNALFFGPSGTGKTTAASVIAKQLGLDIYQIDLARIFSKFIGDTEKMLARIFSAAEDANAILFFDEADALFGKRSEVRDSHDRYANVEIAYLLQRIEQYEGVAILATNLRKNMDDAFLRRLQFVVEFPFPDETARAQIWRIHFPPQAPRDPSIDFASLGKHFRISGGNIKNIVVAAAYAAATDGAPIGMSHLTAAARREYQKLGMLLGAAELGPFAVEMAKT